MFLVVPIVGIVATTWRTVLRVFGDPPEDGEVEPLAGMPDEPRVATGSPAVPGTDAAGDAPAPLQPSAGEATAGA